jgi:hypothetical protein
MENFNGKLMSVAEFQPVLATAPEQLYAVAGDESLLARLPKGNWIGGSPHPATCGSTHKRESLRVMRNRSMIATHDSRRANDADGRRGVQERED